MVDVHVHLRQPGGTHKEDFSTGTQAAIAGGYTQVLDMPNNTPPTTTLPTLNEKIKLAKNNVWCDIGFNFGATGHSVKFFRNVYKKTFGLKVYMGKTTGPLLITDTKEKELIFKSWISPLPIMVHIGGEEIAEAIDLAKKYNKRLHICHTTGDQISFIKKAKKEGLKITCEVSPHHLFLDKRDLKKLGPLAMMKPPLEDGKNQQILWDNLNVIDMIATDHAPHTLTEKQDKNAPPFGVPGLETTLPLMMEAVSKKLITFEKFIEMTSYNPRKVFNIPHQSDTYVLVDISKTYKISDKKLFTKCNWTPFSKLNGRGEVVEVILRGKTVYKNGKFLGKPSGKIMLPEIA